MEGLLQYWQPLFLSLKLSLATTLILLLICIPSAWYLLKLRSSLRKPLETIIALPIVLPPSVLGFYLLMVLGPQGPIGKIAVSLTGSGLAFSFTGLIIGSTIYSLPFVMQPILNSFEDVPPSSLQLGASLGAGPLDRFFSIVLPHSRSGILKGGILGFAHTLGEFGVVLMIGGNIPGETRVAAIAIYDHVEALEYAQAHVLSGILLVLSFSVLLFITFLDRKHRRVL